MAVLSHLGPTSRDTAAVAAVLSALCRALAATMAAVALVGLVLGEHRSASALVVGASVSVLAGTALSRRAVPSRLTWGQAFQTAGFAWLVAAPLAAVPLLLSGHHDRVVLGLVEAMAGLTTTGATYVGDLDHLSVSMNLWRHAMHSLGAVAALLVVTTIRQRGEEMVTSTTVAERGEQRILPRRGRTLRASVGIVVVWSVLGTLILFPSALAAGAEPGRALLHAVTLATSATSTGGFALTSASAGALHAPGVELVLTVLMIAGATSVVLHRALWGRRHGDLHRELDVRVAVVSAVALGAVVLAGLARAGVHTDAVPLLRRGVLQLVAAHTTTGFHLGRGELIATSWGDLAPAALVAAMVVGGMAGSIAGGVGTLRIGLIVKGIVRDVRGLLLPEAAVVVETYHQRRRRRLTDQHVRASATILLLSLSAVFAGAVAQLATTSTGTLPEALLAAVSAWSTTGLQIGFDDGGTDAAAVLVSGGLMWLGRVEFLAGLAAFGVLARVVPGVGGRG